MEGVLSPGLGHAGERGASAKGGKQSVPECVPRMLVSWNVIMSSIKGGIFG